VSGGQAGSDGSPTSIVLCSDGTWNRGGPGAPTNVWRLHQAVDRNHAVTAHDNGVGTERNLVMKFLGGAFGVGLHQNVADLYAVLVRHYEPGMKIYLFGFSRGAFTVRLLSGVIGMFGVVKRDNYPGTPEHAAKKVVHAFRLIHAQDVRENRAGWSWWTQRLLGGAPDFEQETRSFITKYCHEPTKDFIEFVGVWDTVRAIGGPLDGFVTAMNELLCLSFRDLYLSSCVRKGCQALAVDENRQTFAAIPWEITDQKGRPDTRVEQQWFTGCHSDVGGGYAKNGLSSIALDWMIDRAKKAGLKFDPEERQRIKASCDPYCALHNPRLNRGLFYRYKPRVVPPDAQFHDKLRERISAGTSGYAPGNLKPSDLERKAREAPVYSGLTDQVKRWAHAFGLGLTYRVRSWAHAFGLGLVLVFLAVSMFYPQSLKGERAAPGWANATLGTATTWVEHVVPLQIFDELVCRPLAVLKSNAWLFWAMFVGLLGSFLVCWVSRLRMESRAASEWDKHRRTDAHSAVDHAGSEPAANPANPRVSR